MDKIKKLWNGSLPPFPGADLERVRDAAPAGLYDCAACFWLFRYLHGFASPDAALMGDYCFGRFSAHLSALDSVPLNSAFSGYLLLDCVRAQDLERYELFLRGL